MVVILALRQKSWTEFLSSKCSRPKPGSPIPLNHPRSAADEAPAHEAGGLCPLYYAAAKTLLRQVNYSDSCASSSAEVSLLVARLLRRYGIYRGFGVLSKESAPAFSASSATPQQFSSWNAFLCFQWFGPRTIVHSGSNASDICTVRAQSLFRSLGGKPESTVESSTCIVSGRSAAW